MMREVLVWVLGIVETIVFHVTALIIGKSHASWDLSITHKEEPLSQPIGDQKKGETRPFRNYRALNGVLASKDGIETLDQLFRHVTKTFPERPCIGTRKVLSVTKKQIDGKPMDFFEFDKVKWTSYKDVGIRVQQIANGIIQYTGLNSGDKLAIYENTCPEWQLVCQACIRYGIQVVTVYASLGLEALVTSLNETEITVVFTGEELLPHFEQLSKQVPTLKKVIYNPDRFKPKENPVPPNLSCELVTLAHIEELGKTIDPPAIKKVPTKDDIAFIMYTSGTTGAPKGVIHRQNNLYNVVQSTIADLNTPERKIDHLAYLPLAHIFEFGIEVAAFSLGSKITYGNPKTLTDKFCTPFGDLRAAKPNLIFGVPRVFDTIKKAILEIVQDTNRTSSLKRKLFELAFEVKKRALENKRDTLLLNKIIFANFKKQLGGNVDVMVSGGAPMSKDTQEFLRICFGASVCQIYGLTEVGAATVQPSDRPISYKNVGPVIRGVDVKLVDVPEMGYMTTDNPPRGEIVIRGLGICAGYFKQEEKTKEVFTDDGWFYTGDVGSIDERGYLSVIDRRKNLVKLSHGEYIALERLESVYGGSRYVIAGGVCVYADSYHDASIANVLVQPSRAENWAKENQIEYNSIAEICKNEKFRKEVLEDLNAQGKKAKLLKVELLQDIRVHADEWTPENGMLTAAMKIQRHAINKRYEKELAEMYGK